LINIHELVSADLTSNDSNILSDYLRGKVTNNCTELNAWFEHNGFPGMTLSYPPNGMGIGSIFDLLVDWVKPGRVTSIFIDNKRYEGVEMKSDKTSVTAYKLEGYDHPMFELSTKQDKWKVFLVETDEYHDSFDLPARAQQLLSQKRQKFHFTKLKFPQVLMEAYIDITWLHGMKVQNGFNIHDSMKMIRLRLDDKGARAQSAVALVTRSLDMRMYTITKPFFIIFMREDLKIPPFVALSSNDTWKEKALFGQK